MNRRTDDKTIAERLAFASFWFGMIALCLTLWYGVGLWLTQ